MLKEHDTCTMAGCDRPHKARGYCQTHYMQLRRGAPVTPEIRTREREKPPECVAEGCAEPVKAHGLCKKHYQRKLRHGHVKNRDRTKPFAVCSIKTCDNHVYALGICHPHYLKTRDWRAQGFTAQDYEKLFQAQNGVCAICSRPEGAVDSRYGKTKDLAIDHDHVTGAIRALLCSNCNRGLGLFNDDEGLLAKAQTYVLYHRQSGQTPACQTGPADDAQTDRRLVHKD
jgi:hypothetical protein